MVVPSDSNLGTTILHLQKNAFINDPLCYISVFIKFIHRRTFFCHYVSNIYVSNVYVSNIYVSNIFIIDM